MKYHSIIILLLLGFAVGCGKGHVQQGGTIVFSDDGSPVPLGTIVFSTPTFQSQSIIDTQGRFTMSSFGANDGLPPGTYSVAIFGVTEPVGDDPSAPLYSLIDPKYNGASTSGIEITVDKSVKDLEIKVDRNPTPRSTRR